MTNRVGVSRPPESGENAGVLPRNARAAQPGDRPEGWPGEAFTPDGLWNVGEVADYLNVPRNSIYKMTCRRASVRIPHILIGGRLRFKPADIERWLTLLSVSNLDLLEKTRKKSLQVTHGNHSQAETR